MEIRLQRMPDGTFIDWGRSASINGIRGFGGAVLYEKEDAAVIELLIKYKNHE